MKRAGPFRLAPLDIAQGLRQGRRWPFRLAPLAQGRLFNFAAAVSLAVLLAMVFVCLAARGHPYVISTRFVAWGGKLIVGTASDRGAGLWVVHDWPVPKVDKGGRPV